MAAAALRITWWRRSDDPGARRRCHRGSAAGPALQATCQADLRIAQEGLAAGHRFGDPLLKYLGLLFTSVNQWTHG